MTVLDDFARLNGFEDAKEMNKLVASVDLSTPDKLKAFEDWKQYDGTKETLLQLAPPDTVPRSEDGGA